MKEIDELSYVTLASNCIDANTTNIIIPNSDSNFISITCGEERIRISCKDLFRLLKWAYGQWGERLATSRQRAAK